MNLSDFFNSPVVSLPRGGFETAKCTFDVYLRRIFTDYLEAVENLDDPKHTAICEAVKQSIPEIRRVAGRIVRATRRFLEGYPHEAYQEVKNTLRNVKFDSLLTEVSSFEPAAPPVPFDLYMESTLHPTMFRMRQNFGLAAVGTLKRKDIFHVPFESRNLVSNQRYSIAGLPCLYLGSSTWICWEELDRPDLNGCIFSKFKFVERTTILDFQLPPTNAWKIYSGVVALSQSNLPPPRIAELRGKYDEAFIISYILYWPLIAASSIRVEARTGAFFPQYIVPQLLLQWVTKEHKVDGIRYFSTRTSPENYYVNVNYVFPARDIKYQGRCSVLRRKLHLATPVMWAMVELTKDPRDQPVFLPGTVDNRVGFVEFSKSMKYPYSDTKFFDFEKRFNPSEQGDDFGPVEA